MTRGKTNARKIGRICLAVLLLSGSSAALAQDAPENHKEVEVIHVKGTRSTPAELRAPTAFSTVIDLAERAGELETVPDVLSQSVGVQVRRFGGLGSFSTISIRGSEPNQVQIYLNGIPLSRAQDETVNLSNLPLDSLDRIEVYRGTIPVGFGGGGIGGVVNLVTKEPSATPETDASVSYGSFETRKVVLSHSRSLEGLDVLGNVTYQGSKGDFTFESDNGTDKNPDDDFTDTRRNNEFNSVDALARAEHEISTDTTVDLTQEFFYKDQGVPGPDTPQFLHTSLKELRSLTYLRFSGTGWLDDAVDLSGTLFGIYERQEFDDPDGELGGKQATRNETGFVGVSTTGSYFGLAEKTIGVTPTWFSELSYEQFSPFDKYADPSSGPNQTRIRFTLSGQNEFSLWNDLFLLIPTFRYEHLRDDFNVDFNNRNDPVGPATAKDQDLWSPSLGAEAHPVPWFTAKGNIGRFQRAPNFTELFGNTGNLLGRGSLKPETSINRDIGFVFDPGPYAWLDSLRLEYAYFNNDVDDLISFRQVSPGRFRPENISSARIRGHEVVLRADLADHLHFDFNYTHQDTKDLSDIRERRGQELPLRPPDEVYLRVEPFNQWGRMYYEFNYVSGNPTVPSNIDQVPSRLIHTLGITIEPLDWLSTNFEVRNLTDADVRDLGDFPLPGRSFFATVSVKL